MANNRPISNNNWTGFLIILSGIVLGGFLGYLARNIGFLSWLNYGQEFGLDQPIVLNLGILILTFGLRIKITIASIIGVVIGIIINKKL